MLYSGSTSLDILTSHDVIYSETKYQNESSEFKDAEGLSQIFIDQSERYNHSTVYTSGGARSASSVCRYPETTSKIVEGDQIQGPTFASHFIRYSNKVHKK